MRALRPALALLLAVGLGGCGKDTPIPTGVGIAVLSVTVAPNPITAVISNPLGPTFTVRWTSTIKESAGLGVTLESVKASLFDDVTGALIGATLYDDKDLVVFVGSKRVEASGSLDVPQQISYSATEKRAASLTVTVRAKDDRGNIVEQALLVKVN